MSSENAISGPTPKSADTEAAPSAAFTPGPWRAIGHMGIVMRDATAPFPADHVGNVEICRIGDWRDRELIPFNGERWAADARLIAAAPDQHAACREARAVFGKLDLAKLHAEDSYLHAIVRHAMDALDAAIAKATDPDRLNKMGRG